MKTNLELAAETAFWCQSDEAVAQRTDAEQTATEFLLEEMDRIVNDPKKGDSVVIRMKGEFETEIAIVDSNHLEFLKTEFVNNDRFEFEPNPTEVEDKIGFTIREGFFHFLTDKDAESTAEYLTWWENGSDL